MMLSTRDWIWVIVIAAGIASTYGMLANRVTAIESKIKDLDMLRIDSRLSVIEVQVIEINEKLDKLLDKVFLPTSSMHCTLKVKYLFISNFINCLPKF